MRSVCAVRLQAAWTGPDPCRYRHATILRPIAASRRLCAMRRTSPFPLSRPLPHLVSRAIERIDALRPDSKVCRAALLTVAARVSMPWGGLEAGRVVSAVPVERRRSDTHLGVPGPARALCVAPRVGGASMDPQGCFPELATSFSAAGRQSWRSESKRSRPARGAIPRRPCVRTASPRHRRTSVPPGAAFSKRVEGLERAISSLGRVRQGVAVGGDARARAVARRFRRAAGRVAIPECERVARTGSLSPHDDRRALVHASLTRRPPSAILLRAMFSRGRTGSAGSCACRAVAVATGLKVGVQRQGRAARARGKRRWAEHGDPEERGRRVWRASWGSRARGGGTSTVCIGRERDLHRRRQSGVVRAERESVPTSVHR